MNEQQMQQLLAFMQQQMQASQQNMADLPQRAMQAGATPTQGSGGTILSPDPVRRVQQRNEEWRERFPNPVERAAQLGMTPEALLASQGNTATNQIARLGGMIGIDPQKLMQANRDFAAERRFQEAQRTGTNGVTSQIPASEWEQGANYRVGQAGSGSVAADGTRTITSPYGTASMRPQGAQVAAAPAAPQTPAAPVTAGVPAGDLFGGAMATAQQIPSMVGNAASSIEDAYRQAVIPNAPINTSVAPPVEGSALRRGVIQGLSFIPNMLLGAGSTISEGLGSIFGQQFDLPQVNLESDFFSNVGNLLNNPQNGNAVNRLGSDVSNAIRGSGSVLPERSSMRQWLNTFGDQPAGPAPGFAGPAYQATPTAGSIPGQQAAAPVQPNFFNQVPGFNQGQTTPMTQDQTRNMFMTEEEKKRRQQQQPMFAGR